MNKPDSPPGVPFRPEDYDYELPPQYIAQQPLEQRDHSRMLVMHRAEQATEHSYFFCLPEYLNRGDLLVLNDTRVIPARLLGKRAAGGGGAELLLLHRETSQTWEAMVRPGRRLMPGARVVFSGGLEADIREYRGEGIRLVHFSEPLEPLLPYLGKVPLPPYIRETPADPGRYQTVYAREDGSSAAPTAGFHFTPHVFTRLAEKGIGWTFVTLHIGPGTFRPVQAADIRDHVMHREYYHLNSATAREINGCRLRGGRVIAVGTTAVRVLESASDPGGTVHAKRGWTGLYIYPGYTFRAVDALLTNFHLPRSTLLMLVSALAGREKVLAAYREAVELKYRFYSFGDCMLIL